MGVDPSLLRAFLGGLFTAALLVSGAPKAFGGGAPEGLSLEEEIRVLMDAERVVLSASLVVDGESDRFLPPSPHAEFHVTASLKGEIESDRVVVVDMAKAPVGLWPREGERRILCLARSASGDYQLSAHHASILPSTDGAREAISAWIEGRPWKPPVLASLATPEKLVPEEHGTAEMQPPASPYAEYVDRAETILVGVLSNVEPMGEGGPSDRMWAEGVFRADAAQEEAGAVGFGEEESPSNHGRGELLGYDAYRAPVIVRFAPGRKPPAAGRYALFLREDRTGKTTGPGFDVVHEIAIADGTMEAQLRREIAEAVDDVLKSRGGQKARLSTIQATLAEWQDAWNARDAARCIKCYSVTYQPRMLFEAGGDAGKELAEQVEKFESEVVVSPQSIKLIEKAEEGRTEAEAAVLIELTVMGIEDRRTAKMKFVREGGEWLVLEEGL